VSLRSTVATATVELEAAEVVRASGEVDPVYQVGHLVEAVRQVLRGVGNPEAREVLARLEG
jgi:hypothetical protein